jgi:hypothetical protein
VTSPHGTRTGGIASPHQDEEDEAARSGDATRGRVRGGGRNAGRKRKGKGPSSSRIAFDYSELGFMEMAGTMVSVVHASGPRV